MGRKLKTVGVHPDKDSIRIDFTWQGQRFRPLLPLKPTTTNLKHAVRLREQILQEIRIGTFDITEHFPNYKFLSRVSTKTKEVDSRTLNDWFKVWEKLAKRSLEHSTLKVYKRHMNAYWLTAFGDKLPFQISHEDVQLHLSSLASKKDDKPGLSRKTQNNILIPLRHVFSLVSKSIKDFKDPTDGIDNLKTQKAPPDPFTLPEVNTILPEVERRYGKELADYFEFACFAGLRSSEHIALLWDDVDLFSGLVIVRRARVLSKDKERTKTVVQREVELNKRARAVLERQKELTYGKGNHVFRNPFTGLPWNDEQTQRRRWTVVLNALGIRYRPPKECRDTSVTLALSAGADPVWVAKQHGHSLQVMMNDYAMWIPGADKGRNLDALNRLLG